jgi:hypothetical protein
MLANEHLAGITSPAATVGDSSLRDYLRRAERGVRGSNRSLCAECHADTYCDRDRDGYCDGDGDGYRNCDRNGHCYRNRNQHGYRNGDLDQRHLDAHGDSYGIRLQWCEHGKAQSGIACLLKRLQLGTNLQS